MNDGLYRKGSTVVGVYLSSSLVWMERPPPDPDRLANRGAAHQWSTVLL